VSGPSLEVNGVSKAFGPNVALDDVTFAVPRGSVVGLLGSNGAGKSTLIRIILGHLRPDGGSALVDGRPLGDHPRPLSRLGAVTESIGLDPSLSGRDLLRIVCARAQLPAAAGPAALESTGATPFANKAIRRLSTGMRQRVALAVALVGEPDVVVLDEPVNGLDPEGIAWLRSMVRGLATEGRSVLMSSHLLAEVAQTVDRVVVLNRRVLFDGSLAELGDDQSLEDRYFSLVSNCPVGSAAGASR